MTQSLRVLFCCEQFFEPVNFSRILKYRIVVDFEVGLIAPQAPDGHRSTCPTSNDLRRRFRMGVPPTGNGGPFAPTSDQRRDASATCGSRIAERREDPPR